MEIIIVLFLILVLIAIMALGIEAWIVAFHLGAWLYFVIVMGSGILCWLICFIIGQTIKKGTKSEYSTYCRMREEDQQEQQKYEDDVKKTILQNRNAYEKNKTTTEKTISTLETQKQEHIHTLSLLPGLSYEDKTKHAVTTMISYLERGKADSIKEALNLYDWEERERADRNANNQILWQMQQQAQEDQRKALEHMEEAQRRHNDAIRESERKRNEKIDDAIRDMKDSLRQ